MINIPHNQRFNSIQDFQFNQEPIGSGSFGVVKLARHKLTCRLYAVKVINPLPTDTEAKLIEREIQLHTQLDHPHLIKLWDTLVEHDTIYMIMEYAEGGNLFYHQNTKTIFTQAEAFKFFTQTLQGVSYLHRNDMVHRDLKPQNLLLDADSNIKICDFGWVAQDITLKRNTFCGTYQYMAPEMLFKGQYDYRVDIWALGILLYELLHGHAPFKGKNALEVQDSMLKGGYQINPRLSQSVRDLISGILQISLDQRLTIQQICNHPWVKNMEIHINNYLKIDNIHNPKEIQQKIEKLPNITIDHNKQPEHRKNISAIFEGTASGHIVHGESMPRTKKLSINKHHSHQKQGKKSLQLGLTKQPIKQSKSGVLRRGKMQAVKTQMNESEMHRFFQKMASKKSGKPTIQLPSFEKDPQESQVFMEVTNKKKQKNNNKSEVEELSKKYPVRFNTEAWQKQQEQPCKLKKNHVNGKLLAYSRSVMRFQKGRMDLKI